MVQKWGKWMLPGVRQGRQGLGAGNGFFLVLAWTVFKNLFFLNSLLDSSVFVEWFWSH